MAGERESHLQLGNKLHAVAVFPNAVVENNGYAGATGCEAHSDLAQVSGHGFFVLLNHFFLSLETCSPVA